MTRAASSLLLLAVVAGCGDRSDASRGGPRAIPVRVATVTQRDVPVELQAVGRVVANQSVAIRAQVSGPIVSVHFTEGQNVKKGDLLVQLDRRPYDAALAEARAMLGEGRARAENARADAKRLAELVEKEYVTRQQYETARANAAALEAGVAGAEAAVQRAALNASYCTIRAPITGRTGRLLVHPGNLVAANAPEPLLTIEQIRPVYTSFSIPEAHLAALRARGSEGATIRIRTGAGAEHGGRVEFVDNAVDPATGTVLVKARVANEDEALWPGQAVDVILRLGQRSNATVAPVAAVAAGQSGDYAYVVTAEKKVEMRPVEVALSTGGDAVIEKGLRPGEVVVTEGHLKLRPGATVEILAERAEAKGPRS
jgi:multidrug efflux system membrane fusion protein